MDMSLSKPESAPVRTFLAIDLPSGERARLGRLQTDFAEFASFLKWSSPELLHITLRFLGNVPAARLSLVEDAARAAAAQTQPFSLHLSGLGAFPTGRSPRVIWVGLERDAGYATLEHLFIAAEDCLDASGFGRESRAFSPHITLARTRDAVPATERRHIAETLARVQAERDVHGSFDVTSLVVMQSDLRPTGPHYTPLATVPLRGRGT
jgi:RNA 2',3'-cyclic 3'-phosphodiesterase